MYAMHTFIGNSGAVSQRSWPCFSAYHSCLHGTSWALSHRVSCVYSQETLVLFHRVITNPQEMFYCISYVYSQEILALFECVSCMLGKHFTDCVTFPVQLLTVKNKQTSKQTMLRSDESVYSVPFLQTWKPPEEINQKRMGND